MVVNHGDENQKKKSRLLTVLVLSFTVLILLAWIFNLQNRLQDIEDLTFTPKDDEFSEIKDDLDQVVEDLSVKLKDNKDDIGQIFEENNLDQEENQEAGGQDQDELDYPPLIEDPLVDPISNDCPKYVNCMPTVGGPAGSCYVAPACEGITQVVW